MTDRFSGLTRRVNTLVYERETSEELSHLVEEAKEVGGDAADATIELGSAPEEEEKAPVVTSDPAPAVEDPVAATVTEEDEGLDAVVEDDDDEDAEETALVGDEAPADANGDGVITDDEIDADDISDEEIADVADDVDDEDGDEDEDGDDEGSEETVEETASALKLGEVNII
jgi:hypothetical protein